MRKAIALTLVMLPSACAGIGNPASAPGIMTIPGAMNAPVVLRARETPTITAQTETAEAGAAQVDIVQTDTAQAGAAQTATVPAPGVVLLGAPQTTDVIRSAPPKADVRVTNWGTTVDYDHSIDRPDMLASATRNQDTSRPAFATLKRSFGTGEFRPYIGVGVGQASSKFGAIDPGTQEGYAVKGVLGGNLFFTKEVGGYVQYDYAIAAENPALADDDKSHGISLGLKISLN